MQILNFSCEQRINLYVKITNCDDARRSENFFYSKLGCCLIKNVNSTAAAAAKYALWARKHVFIFYELKGKFTEIMLNCCFLMYGCKKNPRRCDD